MWGSSDRMNVTAGQPLTLTCIFSGFPVPKLTWYKENSEMPLNRLRHENFGKTLVIDPVHPEDQGTYVCRAGARSASVDDSHRMAVLITAAPHWKDGTPPESKVALEEERSYLKCDAAGDPLPAIDWYRNGKSLESELVVEDGRYKVEEEGRVLSISFLNHDIDTAVFQCNASNPFGYVFANAYLHVLAHSPEFDTPLVQEIKKVIGHNAYLDCQVRAAPAPKVKWLNEHHRPLVIADRLKLHPNYTLEIQDLILNDAAVYRCNVSNKFGYNEALRRLQVYNPIFLVKPLILPSESDEEGKVQERVTEAFDSYELSCEFQADERLPVKYIWLHNGKSIELPSEDRRHSLLQDNELRLTDLRGKDTGVYTCVGETDVDRMETKMKLIVKDVPEPPKISEITCNERRAKIRWEAPFDNYDPITSYVLEFMTGYHPNKWRLAVNETDVDRTDPFYAVMMLSPWVSYTFRVVAINSHGRSVPGIRPTNCTTPSAPPYKNPVVTRVQGTEKTNLVIYWEPLDKEDHNADGLRYLIKYRLNVPGAKQVEFYEHDSLRNHTIIREQDTFREYTVQVIACNDVDCSLAKPKDYIGYSGEDVPTEAPKNVTIVDIVNSTAVQLAWKKVSDESVLGHFQGYKVRIWELVRRRRRHGRTGVSWRSKRALAQLPDILVPPGTHNVIVDNLKPMRHYQAKVLAHNMKFEGPLSEPVKFEMPEGPPSIVTNLQSSAVGATSVFTSWDPPEHTNGIMTGYYILFKKHLKVGEQGDGESRWSDIIGKAFVLAKNRYHLWKEAEPLTRYFVSVAAETGGGIGTVNSKVVTTFPLQEPNKPNMTIQILRYDSVKATWLPSEHGMSGVGFYVNYTFSDSNQWKQSDWKPLPAREIVLNDLRADKEYQLVVVSRDVTPNADYDTASDVKKFKIANALNSSLAEMRPKGESHPTEMLTSAAWFIAVMFGLALAFVSAIVICICTRSTGGKYPVKKKEMERGHNLNIDEERSFLEYQYGSSDQKSPEGPS